MTSTRNDNDAEDTAYIMSHVRHLNKCIATHKYNAIMPRSYVAYRVVIFTGSQRLPLVNFQLFA